MRDDVIAMLETLDRGTLRGLRDRAMLLLGFAGELRRNGASRMLEARRILFHAPVDAVPACSSKWRNVQWPKRNSPTCSTKC